jgi:hypothetical protein
MEQPELLQYAVGVLEARQLSYMLVGSLASGVFGEGRLTNDIDIVVELTLAKVDDLCRAFPSPEYYVSSEAATKAVARQGQFNVIHPTSGNKIDFMIARSDAWGKMQLSRRRREFLIPGLSGYVAAPEDVILAKMMYYKEGGSEKHRRDIGAMLRISSEEIDREYVAHWAAQLGVFEVWQGILQQTESK